METVLITGGLGFIGTNFIRFLFREGYDFRVVNIDKITHKIMANNLADIEKGYPERYAFFQTDICAENAVKKIFQDYHPDYVINFAAESHVDRSITDPRQFVRSNVMGTHTLLELAKTFNISKFIQISTDEVYGDLDFTEDAFTETHPLSPNNPYSATKASADLLVGAFHHTYDLPVNITRCSNNYGPYQLPEKFLPKIILNALHHKKIPVYGEGINIREWIYVEDHCRAIMQVLRGGKSGEIYNVGADNELSNINLVKRVLDILGKQKSLINYVEDRPGHDLRYAINHHKITEDLGWRPQTDFQEGLRRTIEWYQKNSEWALGSN